MAESPDYGEIGSPPSPPNSDSAKPPPPPPPAPEESNDQSPADPPPSSSSSSPPPSSSSSSTPPPQTNNDSNRNNSAASNATRQPPPAISPPAPKQTPQHGRPALASIAPPPKPYSKSGRAQNNDGPETSSFPTWEVKVGIAVAVVSSVIACFAIITIAIICTRKKRSKSDKHIQYYNNSPMSPRGEKWNMNTNQANNNNHLVINLPPRPGGNAGHGGRQQRSPQGQMANLGGDMSPTYSVQNSTPSPLPKSYGSPMGLNQFAFSYEEIALATKGFSRDNLLGQGGFGYVHKGVLPNGKEIAVKCLKSGSRQGEREFQAEVEIISRVHHRHLVSLVGYCIAGDQKMLVYEFVSNNTLEFHLHDNKDPIMDWTTRVKIALGAAKGLAYLHEDCHPRIIHRDIKSANILLDFNFEAKVADFGLAKLSQDNNTHVSTRVMGTFGYLAPEYASSGKLTDKSDVFSFGVVLLELISGRRPLDLKSDMDESLVDWARPLCNSATDGGDFKPLVDPRLENNYNHDEMTRMVACAGSCIRHSAGRRPKMRQIVRALEGDVSLSDLREAVTLRSGSNALLSSMSGSDDFDSDASNHGKFALEKKDYVSSDFGNTSEYGLHPSSSSSDESGYIGRRRERR